MKFGKLIENALDCMTDVRNADLARPAAAGELLPYTDFMASCIAASYINGVARTHISKSNRFDNPVQAWL